MPQLEHFRIKVFRAVAEHLSFRKGGRTRKEALAYSYPAHFRPQAIQSTALNLSLDKQEQMQYCLVKVLATVSPVRPSFLQAPALHPENDRFFTPLFSASSESLFSQLLCFHIYLRSPIVFFLTPEFPCLRALGAGLSLSTLLSSAACRLFVCSLRVFSHALPLFSVVCSLFPKNTRVGYPAAIAERSETYSECMHTRVTMVRLSDLQAWFCALRGSAAIQSRNATWTRLAHPIIIAGERSAAGSRSQVYG
jgi:hypothetical protein